MMKYTEMTAQQRQAEYAAVWRSTRSRNPWG